MAGPTTHPTRSRIPKLSRHKATGQAVVRLNGKDVYCGRHGTAEAQAKYERVITEWLQRGRQLPPWLLGRDTSSEDPAGENGLPSGGLSVAELILAYKIHTDDYYRNSPKEREKIRLAMRPLRQLYGLTPAAVFGPLPLKAVRQKMLEVQTRTVAVRDKKGQKVGQRVVEYRLSRRTINMRVDIIKRMLAWAVENDLVPAAVHHGLRVVKGLRKGRSTAPEPRKVQPVPDTRVAPVLPLVTRPVRAMIELQRLTGARSGEICTMRPRDIDRGGTVWIYRPARHKNNRQEDAQPREIPIGPRGQAVLAPFLDRGPEEYVFSPRQAMAERYQLLRQNRKSKVPPSQLCRKKPRPRRQPGERYTVGSYRRAIVKACKKAGIAPWHPHQLRHTAATFLRKEYGVETARIILGHATAFTTEIYAEKDRQHALEVMAEVG
jgi:integrase